MAAPATKPKITFEDVLRMAKSASPDERKKGFEAFIRWCRAAPRLPDRERLTQMERHVLTQLFDKAGLRLRKQSPPPRTPPRTSVPPIRDRRNVQR